MDADWNHALSPQGVNRDLGRVDIERTRELSRNGVRCGVEIKG